MHPTEEDAFQLSVELRKVDLLEEIATAVGADVEERSRCPRCNLFVVDVESHREDCPGSRRAMRMLQNPEELAAFLNNEDEGTEDDDEETEQDDAAVESPFDPGDMLVSDLQSRLEDNEYSDDELDALLTAEQEGRNRSTAIDAIESEQEA